MSAYVIIRTHFIVIQSIIAAAIFFLFVKWPRLKEHAVKVASACFSQITSNRKLAVVSMFVAPFLLRLALLPLVNAPVPGVHDEFGYLLSGDTFAHGRLTNNTPALWQSFDTFHELFTPTYASMYPPAQGFFLALGEILGNPWFGVLLSVALFCAVVVWALQAWMPNRWAFLAGAIVTLNIGLMSYWINSYWGGAVAGLGGALVLGAVPRLLKADRVLYAVLFGSGIFLLANSRPLEGALYSAPFALALIIRTRSKLLSRSYLCRTLLPIALCLVVTFGFIMYYNRRVTGSCFVMPHLYRDNLYSIAARFVWEKPQPYRQYSNKQFQDYYGDWERNHYRGTIEDFFGTLGEKAWAYSELFLWIGSIPLLVCIPLIYRSAKGRTLLGLAIWSLIGLCTVHWPSPHYAGPVSATFYGVLVYGARYLKQVKIAGKQVGANLLVASIVLLMLSIPAVIAERLSHPDTFDVYSPSCVGNIQRARLLEHLMYLPGTQLVFVRYSSTHNVHQEWVFNGADIDSSPVVWARELGVCQNVALATHFSNRHIWLVEPDFTPPRLTAYVVLRQQCTR